MAKPKFNHERPQDPRYEELAAKGKTFDYSTFMEAYRSGKEWFFIQCEQAFLAKVTPDSSLKTLSEEMATGDDPVFESVGTLSKYSTIYEVFTLNGGMEQDKWTGVDKKWTRFYGVASFLKNNALKSIPKWFDLAKTCTPKELRDLMREAAGKGAMVKEPKMLQTSTWDLIDSALELLKEDVGETISKDELLEKLIIPVKEMASEARREWWARLHGEPGKPLADAIWEWVREQYETRDQQNRFINYFVGAFQTNFEVLEKHGLLERLNSLGYGYALEDVVDALGSGNPS